MAIRILSSENITGNITVSGTGTFAGDITLDDDLNFTTNGFADISNTGTGAMRFKPSSQTLALTLTNANAAFEGKVGIGTTSPARELEVQGGGNVYIRVTASTDNDSAALELKNTQEMWTIRNEDTNADALHFNSDGGTKMVIETGGNVGIGETSPNEKLHVNGGTANVVANFESTDAKAYISFKDSSTTNTDTVFLGAEGNNMTFYAGSASSERMRIDSSGNVGIGEASPDSLLTVGGDFTATTAKPTVSVSDMTNGGSLGIRGLSPILAFDKTASGVPKILMDGGGLEFKDGTLDSQGSVDLKIDSSGNVGIGKSTSLTSHRLSILKGGSNQQLGLYYDETNVAMFGARSNGDAQIYAWNGSSYRNILLGVDGSSTGGNVGIGTDSPSSGAKLDVNGSLAIANTGQLNLTRTLNTNNLWYGMRYDNNEVQIYTYYPSDRSITFNTVSGGTGITTQLMKIEAGGNVGIGTDSPSNKLDVFAANNYEGIALTDSDETLWNILKSGSSVNTSYFNMFSEGVTKVRIHADNVSYFNGGNVGIGTTSPTLGKLQVAGSGYFGPVGTGNATTKAEMQSNAVLRLKPHDNNSTNMNFAQVNGGGGMGIQVTNGPGTANWDIALSPFGGNVGIGTTSPAEKLTIDGTVSGAYVRISNAGSGDVSSGYMIYNGSNLDFNVYTNPTFGNTTLLTREALAIRAGGSERMRIDSSGNVGIGTTSPSYPLDINGNMAIRGASGPQLLFFETGSSYTEAMRLLRYQDKLILTYGWNANEEAITIVGGTGSDVGNVGIGNTSPQTTLHTGPTTTVTNAFTARFAASNFFASGGNSMFYVPDAAANIMMFGSNQFGTNQIEFYHKNPGTSQAYVGRISTSGSATSYVTSSDYRLKENIVPISESLSRLNQLKPSRFNFIEEPGKVVDGFIAHEVQDIVPEAIVGEKDEVDEEGGIVPQGIDQAKLVPLLVAAVQELEARVKELENK